MFVQLVRLSLFLAWLGPGFAFAGYAQLAPPPAFQSVGGVSTMNVGAAANGARYAGGHVMANATLNLGARAVTVPVAMRVAANAATFAVTKMNPWIAGLSLAASAIPYVIDWFTGSDLEVTEQGKILVKGVPGEPVDAGDGDYWVDSNGATVRISEYGSGACANAGGYLGAAQCTNGVSYGYQAVCKNYNRSGCLMSADPPMGEGTPARPPTSGDLAQLANSPINPALFPELGIPLPVDPVPIINPAVEPVGDVEIGPNGNPAPQLQPNSNPLRFPDGDPIPVPNTDPQLYNQPWLEVHPSPTVDQPWRVDVRPVVTQTTDPNPQPDPTPTPDPVPPAEFYTDCEKFPGSLGCMPVGEPPAPSTIPSETRTFELQSGPTFSGGGCPSNLDISFAGHSFQIVDMSVPCGWISGLVKPIILLLSFITAVFIVRSAL